MSLDAISRQLEMVLDRVTGNKYLYRTIVTQAHIEMLGSKINDAIMQVNQNVVTTFNNGVAVGE